MPKSSHRASNASNAGAAIHNSGTAAHNAAAASHNAGAHAATPESARNKTYTVKALQKTFGVSRNTLLYYEKAGIISPQVDPQNGYRSYTNEDVFRVLESITMRNIGFSLEESQEMLSNADLCAADQLDRCINLCEMRRQRMEVAEEVLRDVRAICAHDVDACKPKLVISSIWDFFFDNAETGYENFNSNDTLDTLLRYFPVTCPAILIGNDFWRHDYIQPRWGRAIKDTLMALLPELSVDTLAHTQLGGTACITLPYIIDGSLIPGFDPQYTTRELVKVFAAAHGLEVSGEVFAVNAFCVRGTFYARLYVPVHATTLAGRLAIKRATNSL